MTTKPSTSLENNRIGLTEAPLDSEADCLQWALSDNDLRRRGGPAYTCCGSGWSTCGKLINPYP